MTTKKFKDYYQDPEFRERHLNYIKEEVECECGMQVARCRLTKHKKTKNHTIIMLKKDNIKLKKENKKLKRKIENFKV